MRDSGDICTELSPVSPNRDQGCAHYHNVNTNYRCSPSGKDKSVLKER